MHQLAPVVRAVAIQVAPADASTPARRSRCCGSAVAVVDRAERQASAVPAETAVQHLVVAAAAVASQAAPAVAVAMASRSS